jgi:hypothetical protein
MLGAGRHHVTNSRTLSQISCRQQVQLLRSQIPPGRSYSVSLYIDCVAPATNALVTAETIFVAVLPQGAYLYYRQVQWSLDRSYSTSKLRQLGHRSHPPMRVLDILIV